MKKALEKMISGKKSERMFLAENSFKLFAIYYFSHYFESFADYHDDFFKDAEDLSNGIEKEILWLGFRGCGKTVISKIFLIWLLAHKKTIYLNVVSYTKENAERILFDIAVELTTNKRFIADYGVLFDRAREINEIKSNKVNNFITQNGVRLEAVSTQESLRGRLHMNTRPQLLLFDDIETSVTKDSKAYTLQIREFIEEALTAMDKDGRVLYLGNLITNYGNIAWLKNRVKHRDVKILDQQGNPTWSRFPLEKIEEIKAQVGSQVFSTEYMNQPIDESLAEFKKEYTTYITQEEVDKMDTRRFITIDTAVSKKDEADFTGITVNYVNDQNKWHIKTYKLKVNPKELIDFIFQLWQKVKPEVIGIEEGTYFLTFKPFLEEEQFKRNQFLNIQEIKHNQVKKESRIRGLIPRWENRGIVFIGENKDLAEEMITFPNGMNDDCIAEDTLILTQEGQKPIQHVKVGDMVMTRQGYKKVIKTWDKGVLPVINKLGIYATKDHRVITTNGEVELKDVSTHHNVFIWNSSKKKIERLSFTKARDILDTQKQADGNTESTTGGMIHGETHQLPCTDKSGLTTLEIYLKNTIYIIKTIIHLIITSLTCYAHQVKLTQKCMLTNQKGYNNRESLLLRTTRCCKKPQKNGGIAKRARNGISNTQETVLTNPSRLHAFLVELKQSVSQPTPDIVLKNVDARKIPGNTEKRKRVYDLMVEDCHEFFANNLLVHNCIDSLSMQVQLAFRPTKGFSKDWWQGKDNIKTINKAV